MRYCLLVYEVKYESGVGYMAPDLNKYRNHPFNFGCWGKSNLEVL